MEKQEELEREINELTDRLRKEKPSTYEHLMESPSTIPNNQNENSDDFVESLNKYKNQLIEILKKDD
ncbi:hypothetical protein ERX46_10260 [Brumimicrobium glaciale]|uniref:Uncharacterized protein n=1 Tax=Brumimicrobium glaciale TaxID=200475 RepID=A0A4Q4KK23_9FLAO|nr:hypothetical protein [Brumimicrobium glaciale]RYM33318.1 hypothetical protein ERX46_10260 [Brumimicrobium glaciale]